MPDKRRPRRITAARSREIRETDGAALIAHGNKRQGPPTVPAKAKKAITYLIDVEDDLAKAAAHAELPVFLLKRYLNLTHVRRHLYDERQVRIDVARAGNVPALVKVRDAAENGMAVVGAVKALEAMGVEDDSLPAASAPVTPPASPS
jgi:hypothetical protein